VLIVIVLCRDRILDDHKRQKKLIKQGYKFPVKPNRILSNTGAKIEPDEKRDII